MREVNVSRALIDLQSRSNLNTSPREPRAFQVNRILSIGKILVLINSCSPMVILLVGPSTQTRNHLY